MMALDWRLFFAAAWAAASVAQGGATSNLRRLQGTPSGPQCELRAQRWLPTPSLTAYDRCLRMKMASNTTHDWGIPGAELAAWVDCWCSENMSQAISDIGCCSHRSFQQWCTVDCTPDCSGSLGQQCIEECPAMCFEAQEYIVDRNLCTSCNATKCFPVMRCLTRNAESLVQAGELDRTCHETDFYSQRDVLNNYKHCWQDLPKHSSHWNVLSAFVHCACREGMIDLTRSTDCCESVTYGGGICDVTCPAEAECASQDAQTCIHSCNELCPSFDPAPSQSCKDKCLLTQAPCRKYLGCRTPMLTMSNYVCEDGKWPESNTGCCVTNQTNGLGNNANCPSLCETKFVWRLDGPGLPWWARYSNTTVYQCTCDGCPAQTEEGLEEVRKTLEDTIWDNGQVLLVDIARREGLQLGPNRQMQELMLERNSMVLQTSQSLTTANRVEVESKIQDINTYYSRLIEQAARDNPDIGLPDDGGDGSGKGDENGLSRLLAILLTLAVLLVVVLIVVILFLFRRNRTKDQSPVSAFTANEQIVIGSPVPQNERGPKDDGVVGGAAVTVAAPTKGRSLGADS